MSEGRAEFGLLGPVEVSIDGLPVDLSAKERALVAALSLEPRRVVSVDRLIEALWGGSAPETANVSVRVHVSRVRRTLADAGADGRIVTRGPGYALDLVAGDALDTEQFRTLIREADEAAAGGRPEGAARLYDAALALWRGPALGEVGDGAFFRPDLSHLEEERLAAVEGRIDAELAAGRHAAVVGELERLCDEHPLRERFWAQRMIALYRAGRQAEALRGYQDLRRRLGDELGLDPSPDLARLEAEILAQDPALAWTPPMPRATHAETGAATPPAGLPSGVVTFLLTDIEGSTTLWDRHPEATAAALERHDALVDRVVGAHDGVVLKAKGEGDATLSVFRRASDAVAGAVAMQRAVAGEPWSPEAPIRVRVAVHTGEAHERDGDYFGPTLNRAARIRALAAGGEVLLSQATVEVVRDRLPDDADIVELGAHRLAGVSRPEQVFAVRVAGLAGTGDDSRAGDAAPVPLPETLAGGQAPFVGRSAELGTLTAAWARAQRGERGVLLVAGEPGIGKTSLVAEVARAAHHDGAVVLFGRCDEESLVPFQPFVEGIAHWVTSSPVAAVRTVLGPQAADLGLLVPEVGQRLTGLPGAPASGSPTDRYRLFEAVSALFQALAERAPTLVVLDDLHWADRPTLQLLLHTVRRTPTTRLLVLGTYRDTELFRTHPLADTLVDLRRADAVQRLALRGLSRDEVRQLLSPGGESGPQADALADALWRDTEGSPLFLRESLRHLEDVGAVAKEADGGWRPRRRIEALGIPEGVKEVIGRRLTRLSEDANDALRTASVIGRQFDPAVVAVVSGASMEIVLDSLDEATRAGVVDELPGRAGHYEFTHALVRDALYDELSISRRVRIHQRVGEAIESLHPAQIDAHLGELAYHFSQAAVAGVADKAIDYARQAAARAMTGAAYEEAGRLFALALDTAEDSGTPDADKADLLLGMGEAQWRSGDQRTAKASFERAAELARRSGDAERLGRSALGYAGAAIRWVWVQPGTVDDRAVEVLEEALAALDDHDSALRARVLGCLGAELHFRPHTSQRCDELSGAALAMARRTGDMATLAYVLSARNFAVLGTASAEERLANADESLALAEQLGDKALAAFSQGNRFMALLDLDQVVAAKEAADTAGALGEEIRDPLFAQHDLYVAANWARLEGRFEEAERLHREAFQLGQEVGDGARVQAYFGPMVEVRRLQGRLHELAAGLDASADVFPVFDEHKTAILAWVHGEARDSEAPRYLAELTPDVALPPMIEVLIVSGLARVANRLRDADAAAWMYERLLPHAHRNAAGGGNMCSGTVSHAVALLADVLDRPEESVRWFADALGRYEVNGWAPLRAEAQAQLAAVLVDTDPSLAEAVAAEALADARRLGMAVVAADAEDVLARVQGQGPARRSSRRYVTRRDRLRGKLSAGGRRVVGRLVDGVSDEDLVRRFGSPLAQHALFAAMARSFQPAMAFGFDGGLCFELRVPIGTDGAVDAAWWTIELHGRRASVTRGKGTDPAVTVHVDLPDFLRMASGELPIDALMEDRLQIEGDVLLLVQAAAMFGAVEPFDLVDSTTAPR